MKKTTYSCFDHLEGLVTQGHYSNNNYHFSVKQEAQPVDLAHCDTLSLARRVVCKVDIGIRGFDFLKHQIWQHCLHSRVPTTSRCWAVVSPLKGACALRVATIPSMTLSLSLILITHITCLAPLGLWVWDAWTSIRTLWLEES